MNQIFITILNMSLTAGYCIVAVILLRFFLKRQSKLLSYLLWSVVLFRLLCPFSLSSQYSLLRMDTNVFSQEAVSKWDVGNMDGAGWNALHGEQNMLQETETGHMDARTGSAEDMTAMREEAWIQKAISIAAWVWMAGMLVLICYSMGTAYRLRRSLKGAVLTGGNQYVAEAIATPFVFGVIRPRIYLPAHLRDEDRKYVLVHEQIHIARKDYLVKLVAYGAVCVHWFNPLVWLAFILMESDMEMSCDEAVLRKMGTDSKKEYSLSLLSLSSERTVFQGSPLAFGEGKVKGRIRNILSYRKRTFLAVVLAVIILIAAGVGLILNPADAEEEGKIEAEAAGQTEAAKITAFVESYAEAHCNRDGSAIMALYVDEETALANESDRLLEKVGDVYSYGFSSPWPDSYRYEMDWEEEKADIRYYAWTSDPHISVWKEVIQYTKVGEEYRVRESSLQFLDSISSEKEFEAAYWINGEHQFVDYVENGFVDAINFQREDGTSSVDNTVYEKPETAVAHILNLTGGEGRVEGGYTYQAMVRYRFADGSEVMIPTYQANYDVETHTGLGEPIWIVDTAVWNAKAPD